MAQFVQPLSTDQKLRELQRQQNSETKTENNFTNALNEKLSNLYDKSTLDTKFGNKVDKVNGKGLSSNDYTNSEKSKLSGVESGANNYSLTFLESDDSTINL